MKMSLTTKMMSMVARDLWSSATPGDAFTPGKTRSDLAAIVLISSDEREAEKGE